MTKRPPSRHPLKEYEADLLDYHPGSNFHIICDRWHIGEWIYPRVMKRETKMDLAVMRHVNMFLRSRGALVIIMNPELSVLVNRVLTRGDDYIEPGHLSDLNYLYGALEPWMHDMYFRSSTPIPHIIVTHADEAELQCVPLNRFETYIGPPRPQFLLVGETRGVSSSQVHTGEPAFGPYKGTSGHWLLGSLQLGRYENKVGIANACDIDDVAAMWETLGRPITAALGRSADQKLHELGVPHGTAPHPQYARRFLFNERAAYSDTVWAALHEQSDLGGWRP